jgi:catechol 2,3-dioxygenase-like lactoylglutathione lyase family enzyme
MNKLNLISLLVNDYDAAIQFYSQKLGFEVAEDMAFGDERWVTLSLPNNRDVAIALHVAKTSDDQALIGKQGGSFPFFGFGTTDCLGDYQRMKALGVVFQGEPQAEAWGTGVLLEDLYGNKIYINQEPHS